MFDLTVPNFQLHSIYGTAMFATLFIGNVYGLEYFARRLFNKTWFIPSNLMTSYYKLCYA